ncbi:GmrSD restriction endonuclease domain-containing protein [Microbacterium sp. A93]|uniref:GmrSD restriction endonuclease domain-containing protein n=1 Tax=Microbacterium sp. A93 TaxID=3450716 RepID=UPI003F42106E
METRKRTPLELFNLPQHFIIPLFQRPYVWEEEEQWAPLWQDIRRTVEARMKTPFKAVSHFLGAVVLQAAEPASGNMGVWNVVDGQQRLTTLQLLMDATNALLLDAGLDSPARQLEGLTHNPSHYIADGESALKVRHLNKDRAAFDEIMNADPSLSYEELENHGSRIARAHQYFRRVAEEWLGSPEDASFPIRADHLTEVIQGGLQLVSIDLTPDEDSQEIFETLNARGTPLTAADLVRNFVFQRLEAEGADSRSAYERDWPFETKFWEASVSVGRQTVGRSSLFLNQWLISRLGDEISPHNTFSAFKRYVNNNADVSMKDLLPRIRRQADMYQTWTEAASRNDGNLSVVEMAVYRMKASGIELLKPLLLFLTDPSRGIPPAITEEVIRSTESWVYRRQLLRLSNSDLGRIVAEIIRNAKATDIADLVERITTHLTRLNVTSTYWPGDVEVRSVLATEPVYRRYPRARMRMFLEAAENYYRAETQQPQVERGRLPIEHVLPQSWQDSWPVGSPEEVEARASRVHRLGNLTLLTQSLNSKVSNASWDIKRQALLQHNTLTLTGRILSAAENDSWGEELIDRRTDILIGTLLHVWPTPDGHQGTVVDPQAKSVEGIDLKHLIEAGLLSVGETLHSTHRDFNGSTAEVLAGGDLKVHGKAYASPSAAAKSLRKRATNGWYFWSVPDGRRLRDVRAELVAQRQAPASLPLVL